MLLRALLGTPIALPDDLAAAWPELAAARYRVGGLPVRIGGLMLGIPCAAGIALGRTVWVAEPEWIRDAGLLLHEVRHVQQFSALSWFPCRYLWQTVLHGYEQNRYEVDARDYASRRLEGNDIGEGVKA
jgi:hypothetical protein